MLTLSSNEQAESLVKDGVLKIDDDIEIAFDSFSIQADIKCRNIYSKIKMRDIKAKDINADNIYADDIYANNITACNIKAWNIEAGDIKACNIEARNIEAGNIDTEDITACNIKAFNIDALDINAEDINADNINAMDINASNIFYYAVCFTYQNIICESIKGRVENSKHFSLNGEVIIKKIGNLNDN